MTILGCNRMAEDLSAVANVSAEKEVDVGNSGVFSQDSNTGILSCKNGFDEKYEKPSSAGGRYASYEDFQMLFDIGIKHGLSKLNGWKPHWDFDFCNAIGGYPRGSILRTQKGLKMISRRGNNKEPIPEDGKSNSYWKRCLPNPSFRSLGNFGNFVASDGIPLNFTLPSQPTTIKQLAATIDGENEIVMFTYGYSTNIGSYGVIINLCTYGEMSVKVSKYSDLYTNPDHQDDYIEVLHSLMYSNPKSIYNNVEMRTPPKMIPLKKGIKYYLYIEYENGCADNRDNRTDLTNGALRVYKAQPYLAWPTM